MYSNSSNSSSNIIAVDHGICMSQEYDDCVNVKFVENDSLY